MASIDTISESGRPSMKLARDAGMHRQIWRMAPGLRFGDHHGKNGDGVRIVRCSDVGFSWMKDYLLELL